MARPLQLLLLCLGACASTAVQPNHASMAPILSSPHSPQSAPTVESGAPDNVTLPFGFGFTAGPSSTMVGATLDFPIDRNITFGPLLQYGFDDKVSLISLSGQLKYFVPIGGDSGKPAIMPYLTIGAGLASIDKRGRSGDSGAEINGGVGVRYLTGDHYRVGSEARYHYLPEDVAGESGFWTFELLQIVFSF